MNPVVADLFCLRSAQNCNAKITPSVFYHLGPKNTMADYASIRFYINNKAFLYLFYSCYSPQSAGSWIICHLPTAMVSSVICALRKLPPAGVTCQTSVPSPIMQRGGPSAPISASAISFITMTTQWLRYFKCLDTGSITIVTSR